MNLIDALCVVASSYNLRSEAEERVYAEARLMIEVHAEQVMASQYFENQRSEQDSALFRGFAPLA